MGRLHPLGTLGDLSLADDIEELRRELERITGPARTGDLLDLARMLIDRYWRTGPGQARALPDLSAAIEALTEAYGYFAPDDRARAQVAVQLGSLLAARYVTHGGQDSDRETGIERLTEGLGSTGLPAAQVLFGRFMLGQLHLSRAAGKVRTGGLLPAMMPGGGSQVEAARSAAECFRQVLAAPELAPEIMTLAKTMLALAEGIVQSFSGVGVKVGAVARVMQDMQRLQKEARGLGMGSFFTAGTRLARMDPLDRPVIVMEANEEPAQGRQTTAADRGPATSSADPRGAIRELLGDDPYAAVGALLTSNAPRPDVAVADELVALATTVVHSGDAEAGDHLMLAAALALRSRADDGQGADDDADDALQSLNAAAQDVRSVPPAGFLLLLRLGQLLGERDTGDRFRRSINSVTSALRGVGADALAAPCPDGMLLLHAATGRISLGSERMLPRRTLVLADRPPNAAVAIVSTLADHRQLLDLARRRRRPIVEEPVMLAGPEGAELRRCYGRGELLQRATASDVLARLSATVLHLDCPTGPEGTLLLAGGTELTTEAVAAARIGRAGGLVVLPPGAAFPALADAFLTAGSTGVIGWLRPVAPRDAAVVYRELHHRLGKERQAPSAAVHSVRRWLRADATLRELAGALAHRGVH